jgi:hypothetical protein
MVISPAPAVTFVAAVLRQFPQRLSIVVWLTLAIHVTVMKRSQIKVGGSDTCVVGR